MSTEQTYVSWIKRYILSHDKHRPPEMGEKEISKFLISTWLIGVAAHRLRPPLILLGLLATLSLAGFLL